MSFKAPQPYSNLAMILSLSGVSFIPMLFFLVTGEKKLLCPADILSLTVFSHFECPNKFPSMLPYSALLYPKGLRFCSFHSSGVDNILMEGIHISLTQLSLLCRSTSGEHLSLFITYLLSNVHVFFSYVPAVLI